MAVSARLKTGRRLGCLGFFLRAPLCSFSSACDTGKRFLSAQSTAVFRGIMAEGRSLVPATNALKALPRPALALLVHKYFRVKPTPP